MGKQINDKKTHQGSLSSNWTDAHQVHRQLNRLKAELTDLLSVESKIKREYTIVYAAYNKENNAILKESLGMKLDTLIPKLRASQKAANDKGDEIQRVNKSISQDTFFF